MAEPISIGGTISGMLGDNPFGVLGSLLLIFLIAIVIIALLGGVIGLIYWQRTYNQKAILKGKVDGFPQKIAEWKARWVRIPQTNKRLLYIRGVKRYESPKYMSGRNEWTFWRREIDGEWHNYMTEDVDEELNRMKVKHVDGDVRMQSVANEKVLRDRFVKKKDIMAIIAQIAYVVVFILVFVALVVLFTKLKDVAVSMDGMSASVGEMAKRVHEYYQTLPEHVPDVYRNDTGILTPA